MAGAKAVAVIDVALTNLMQTADICQAEGSHALPLACDVSKEDQVKATVGEVMARLGRIDILVNCAGVSLSKPIFLDTFSSIWREMEINFGGVSAFRACALDCADRASDARLQYACPSNNENPGLWLYH